MDFEPPAGPDFTPTPEQEAIRELARSIAEEEIRPHVLHYDESMEFPRELFTKLAAVGFLGIMVPQEYGGAGLGAIEASIIIEEIARVDPAVGLSVAAHNGLCTGHILAFGSEDQRRALLPDLATGASLGAWGLTEPGSGSDSGAMATYAERTADGYTISGSKIFMTHGSVGSTAVVLAKTDRTQKTRGISAFAFTLPRPGFEPQKKENKLGMRCSDTSFVVLDGVAVGQDALLGAEGDGFAQAMQVLDGGRISIAALSLGTAQGALDAAVRYAKERVQFDKPLAEHQAIQFKLAQMAMQVETARLLTHRAAWLRDQHRPFSLAAAQAKLFASEVAVRTSEEAVQIHGGYGYIKDFPVEKFYRDSKLLTIGEGTSEVQRMVIAKHLLRD